MLATAFNPNLLKKELSRSLVLRDALGAVHGQPHLRQVKGSLE